MTALPITAAGTAEPIDHGGDLDAARRRFPDAPLPWIDLSTGINPVPYPIGDLPDETWSRLPTREQERALVEAAARRYAVRETDTIVAAPGTQALIQLLPRLMTRSRVAVVGPTYDEHRHCWARQGHDVRVVPTLAEARGADVTILVNPDNPTGRLVPPSELRGHGRLLIVDEAFIDLFPADASIAHDLPTDTIVLRSFGKTYGLAGLRLGFAIAAASTARRIRDELGPWAVAGPALEIGRRALDDDAWLAATRARLEKDSTAFDDILTAAGFSVIGGTTLFRLAEHPDASAMADRLGRSGIHVRRFRSDPRRLRFGIPTELSRLNRALRP
jgi:cobalamin biosynthetic protein CobC